MLCPMKFKHTSGFMPTWMSKENRKLCDCEKEECAWWVDPTIFDMTVDPIVYNDDGHCAIKLKEKTNETTSI